MADSIKIGNLDISYFKVGGDDCSIYLGTTLLYSPTHDYSKDYLTIRSTSDNNSVSFFNSGYTPSDFVSKEISYSTDSGTTWTTVQSSLNTPITLATLSSGDTLLLKGRETTYSTSNKKYHNFLTTDTCELEGNIMSMTDGDSFEYDESIFDTTFRCLFTKSVNITRIDNLVFPAKSLHSYCYQAMFDGCSGLTSANIVLPATRLEADCYRAMFANCSSLTTVPELPATTLAIECYIYMFQNCTSLTTAPSSIGTSATTIPTNACSYMFSGCISLTTAPELPALALDSKCYQHMFKGCTSLTTAQSSIGTSATRIPTNACSYMFSGCTSLTTAPELPATTLESGCYQYMFQGCTSLTTAPSSIGTSATTIPSNACSNMFSGCTSLTTAPELPATTLQSGCYSYMFNSCTSLTTAPSSIGTSATTMPSNACSYMFKGCTSLTTAPELPATTLHSSCYNYMFQGCTALTTAPLLPAPMLVSRCYYQMFSSCSSLNSITCLATDNIREFLCTFNWLDGVAASGTFTKAASMTNWTSGVSGIPTGWTVVDYSG